MALRTLVLSSAAAWALTLFAATATAQAPNAPAPVVNPANPAGAPAPDPASDSDTWIFSGVLAETSETFSGTLITGKGGTQFELKLADGGTCDGTDLQPSLGLVRLSEITCTDGRTMRALFVPQAHEALKVFGHVGEARFATVAHLLGTQAIPEPKQTTAPHAPVSQPPSESPTPPQARPGTQDPG